MALTHPDQAGPATGRETIEQLFAALESPLLSYALRLTGDVGAAEDLVQEAFMKLQAQFKEVREPSRWLYRAVHNLALNHQRQSRKIIPLEPSSPGAAEAADPHPLPDEQIARSEGLGLLRLTLETLDGRSRELIRLKFTENLSYKQISERTGLKIGHIGYLLHHALKEMASELAKNGVVP
jgi:RNA polymerase sigma factor (sigma-70 family)